MEEPLKDVTRKQLQLDIMKNIELEIKGCGVTSKLRWWWEHTQNWGKVQRIINGRSCKAGSTSSTAQCIFIGIDPDGYSVFDKHNQEEK